MILFIHTNLFWLPYFLHACNHCNICVLMQMNPVVIHLFLDTDDSASKVRYPKMLISYHHFPPLYNTLTSP